MVGTTDMYLFRVRALGIEPRVSRVLGRCSPLSSVPAHYVELSKSRWDEVPQREVTDGVGCPYRPCKGPGDREPGGEPEAGGDPERASGSQGRQRVKKGLLALGCDSQGRGELVHVQQMCSPPGVGRGRAQALSNVGIQ